MRIIYKVRMKRYDRIGRKIEIIIRTQGKGRREKLTKKRQEAENTS